MHKILIITAIFLVKLAGAVPTDSIARYLVKIYPMHFFINQAKLGVDLRVYKNLYINANAAFFYGKSQGGYLYTAGLKYALFNKPKKQVAVFANYCAGKLSTTFNYTVERFDYDQQGNLVSYIASDTWLGYHQADRKLSYATSGYEFGASCQLGINDRLAVELSAMGRILPLPRHVLFFEETAQDPYTPNRLVYWYRFSDNQRYYTLGPGTGFKVNLVFVYKIR